MKITRDKMFFSKDLIHTLAPNKQAEVAQQLENLINGTTVPDTIIKKEKELLRALLIQFCKLEVIFFLMAMLLNFPIMQ